MKGGKVPFDLGSLFDDIFEAAKEFQDSFSKFPFDREGFGPWNMDGVDYYPNYSYPPMNLSMTRDRTLVFEFALAGFEMKDITLSFQGDYMTFEAKAPFPREGEAAPGESAEGLRYLKRRLKMKDVEKQKFFVPQDKFDQSAVKASFKNGILRVTVPARVEPEQPEGVKINIVNADE